MFGLYLTTVINILIDIYIRELSFCNHRFHRNRQTFSWF